MLAKLLPERHNLYGNSLDFKLNIYKKKIPCNTMQYHAIPCNAMQYHAILCNTMQYPASLITADGAYHCPVGSIMAIFSHSAILDIIKSGAVSGG